VTLYQEPSGTAEETIAGIWGEALRLDRVGVLDNFFELGGSSLLGITVLAALRRAFPDVELPPHILFEAPTVAALAKVVDAPAAGPAPAQDRRTTRDQAERRRSGLEAAARRRKR
jgi:hypothetical protein